MISNLLAQGIPITNPALNSRIGVFFNVSNSVGITQTFIRIIINAVLAFAGVYFFFTLLRGGYEFITAGGDKDAVQSARKRIINALIGISVIFGAFAIIFLVETLFGLSIRNFSVPNI